MIIYRQEVRPFTDNQITLVETFADQAAIAIENVRYWTNCGSAPVNLAAQSVNCGRSEKVGRR